MFLSHTCKSSLFRFSATSGHGRGSVSAWAIAAPSCCLEGRVVPARVFENGPVLTPNQPHEPMQHAPKVWGACRFCCGTLGALPHTCTHELRTQRPCALRPRVSWTGQDPTLNQPLAGFTADPTFAKGCGVSSGPGRIHMLPRSDRPIGVVSLQRMNKNTPC